MPRLNGVEAATVLKNAMPETPVILFTMYADMLSETLCKAIGVVCISKTDGASKLLERVDALLSPAWVLRVGKVNFRSFIPPLPLRSCFAQLNHKTLSRRLSEVCSRAAHKSGSFSRTQKFGVAHLAQPPAESFNVNFFLKADSQDVIRIYLNWFLDNGSRFEVQKKEEKAV